MSADRFFVETPLADVAGPVDVAGEEGRHLARVMRKRPGDAVVLFDGSGLEARAVVREVGRDAARVEVTEVVRAPRTPAVAIRLAVALPRGGAADDVLRRAMEAGAGRLVPLLTRRGVHRPERKKEGARKERFRRLAISTLKQCGRNVMPVLDEPVAPGDLDLEEGELGVFGTTAAGAPTLRELERVRGGLASRVCLAVGPEGGWAPEEEEALAARGFAGVTLGPQVLRVETAAVALTAYFAGLSAADLG